MFGITSWLLSMVVVGAPVGGNVPAIMQTYADYVLHKTFSLMEAGEVRGFKLRETQTALTIALSWVHVGPCRGDDPDGRLLKNGSMVLEMLPKSPLGAVVLEMVAILTRDNLGRGPTPDACRFARESVLRNSMAPR